MKSSLHVHVLDRHVSEAWKEDIIQKLEGRQAADLDAGKTRSTWHPSCAAQ